MNTKSILTCSRSKSTSEDFTVISSTYTHSVSYSTCLICLHISKRNSALFAANFTNECLWNISLTTKSNPNAGTSRAFYPTSTLISEASCTATGTIKQNSTIPISTESSIPLKTTL
jgi:hypothetical protein